MTLKLDLPPDVEDRLRSEAERRGLEPEAYALGLIEVGLAPQPTPNNSLARLFAQWQTEDATDDPAEIARRQRDWEELRKALNEDHGSFREPIR
jgi:hypothetical protein